MERYEGRQEIQARMTHLLGVLNLSIIRCNTATNLTLTCGVFFDNNLQFQNFNFKNVQNEQFLQIYILCDLEGNNLDFQSKDTLLQDR